MQYISNYYHDLPSLTAPLKHIQITSYSNSKAMIYLRNSIWFSPRLNICFITDAVVISNCHCRHILGVAYQFFDNMWLPYNASPS